MNRVIQRIFYSHNTLRHQTTPRGLGSSGLQHMSYVRPYEAHLTDPTTLPCHTVASPQLLYSPFQALYCADPMACWQRSSSELSSSAALHRTRQHGSARSQQASVGRRGASNTCDGPHGDWLFIFCSGACSGGLKLSSVLFGLRTPRERCSTAA